MRQFLNHSSKAPDYVKLTARAQYISLKITQLLWLLIPTPGSVMLFCDVYFIVHIQNCLWFSLLDSQCWLDFPGYFEAAHLCPSQWTLAWDKISCSLPGKLQSHPHPLFLPSAEPSRLAGGETVSVLFFLGRTHSSYVPGLKDS